MDIKVTVTQKELHDFYNYGKKLRESPCRDCLDYKYCCGCHRQSEWRQELESLPVTSVDWDKYEDVRKYTEVTLDLEEAVTETNKFLKKQADLRDKAVEIRTKFEVADE